MRNRLIFPGLVVILCIAALTVATSGQQDKSKRPSPPAHAGITLADGKTITMDYSTPKMNGRKIYGGLVPWGKVWRAGANEATTFVTTGDLKVGDANVPAGSYTIFVIPNPDSWTLIVSKATGEWGIPYPGEDKDLVRTKMKSETLPSTQEVFSIALRQTPNGCRMEMDWEGTRASVEMAPSTK